MDLVYRAYPLYHGNWNNLVHCQQIPDVDLHSWEEASPYAKKASEEVSENEVNGTESDKKLKTPLRTNHSSKTKP